MYFIGSRINFCNTLIPRFICPRLQALHCVCIDHFHDTIISTLSYKSHVSAFVCLNIPAALSVWKKELWSIKTRIAEAFRFKREADKSVLIVKKEFLQKSTYLFRRVTFIFNQLAWKANTISISLSFLLFAKFIYYQQFILPDANKFFDAAFLDIFLQCFFF